MLAEALLSAVRTAGGTKVVSQGNMYWQNNVSVF